MKLCPARPKDSLKSTKSDLNVKIHSLRKHAIHEKSSSKSGFGSAGKEEKRSKPGSSYL